MRTLAIAKRLTLGHGQTALHGKGRMQRGLEAAAKGEIFVTRDGTRVCIGGLLQLKVSDKGSILPG